MGWAAIIIGVVRRHKKIIPVVLGIAVFLILLVIYIYYMIFGWTYNLELGLMDFLKEKVSEAFEYTDEEETYTLQLKLIEKNNIKYIVEYNLTDGTVAEPVPYEDYLAVASNMKKVIDADIVKIGDGSGAFLLDDSDTEIIFEKLIEDEKEKEKSCTREYEWLSKEYKYGMHYDPSVFDYVQDESPQWFPDDKWDDTWFISSHWYINTDTVTLSANNVGDADGKTDFRSEKNADGTDRWVQRWQIACAILEMSSTANYDNWENTGDESKADFSKVENGDMDGYYLSDATINRVIDDMAYDLDFWWDGTDKKLFPTTKYKYEDMEKIAYDLELKEMPEHPAIPDDAYIKKTPRTAPNKITNIYETVTYNYVPVEDGYGAYICTGRTIKWDVRPFYEMMVNLCGDKFDWNTFIEVVEHFPASDGAVSLANQLHSIWQWQMETGEAYFLMAENEPCGATGVRLGKKLGEKLDNEEPPEWNPGDTGDGYLDGDFDYVWVDTGWFAISEGARADLTVSDNLSLSQIETLLQYFSNRYGNPTGANLVDAAPGLYQWQQSGGGSITGYLAIWITEGALTTKIGREHWNFGNYTAASGEPFFYSSAANKHKWLDVKAMYDGDISAAIVDQINRVSRNYWAKGQNTYYAMCWRTSTGIYSAQSPEEQAMQGEFVHDYCPYWEDSSFAVTKEKLPNPAYKGWSNNCAIYRELLLSLV